ncbi:hypothetical protein ANN_22716 [Periplaneta americana]|uniref:Uncharacterized protein n=1 Tax=Periplaneta americana TaxID=6978 RepID=A0ABQ8S9U1_PERAM|nr:hypothetical protein ANN_22716 [Periplaneta americana]
MELDLENAVETQLDLFVLSSALEDCHQDDFSDGETESNQVVRDQESMCLGQHRTDSMVTDVAKGLTIGAEAKDMGKSFNLAETVPTAGTIRLLPGTARTGAT